MRLFISRLNYVCCQSLCFAWVTMKKILLFFDLHNIFFLYQWETNESLQWKIFKFQIKTKQRYLRNFCSAKDVYSLVSNPIFPSSTSLLYIIYWILRTRIIIFSTKCTLLNVPYTKKGVPKIICKNKVIRKDLIFSHKLKFSNS